MKSIQVHAKVLGRRGPVLEPIEISAESPLRNATELLTLVVLQQMEAYAERKEASRLLRVLTERELESGIEVGKILSGEAEPDERVPDAAAAIENAITAFKDGLYFLFVNEVQIEDLAESVHEVREVLFVRLTALAGG